MKSIVPALIVLISFFATGSVAQRKVLIEQFTNSGCTPCAGNTPIVAAYVNADLNQVLMVAYHTSFPYLDSMYFENAFQSDARVGYYGVAGVPRSVVDGNYFSGSLLPTPETIIDPRLAVEPRYRITFISSALSGNEVMVKIALQSIDALNENETLKGRVIVVEKNVLKSAYTASPGNNSETEYPWVVRKMLPDENGIPLVNTMLNGLDTITVNWISDNFKDLSEMRIVAFVQNESTKEIYQSEISTPLNATGISQITAEANSLFSLFPTIVKNDFTIHFKQQLDDMRLRVFNELGKEVYTILLDKNYSFQTIHIESLENGIYFIQAGNENAMETKRIVVSK